MAPAQNSSGGRPDRRTTVLHLASDLAPGAEARSVIDLALLTHRGGWRSLIASSGGQLVLEAERSAIRHTRMPLGTAGMIRRWRCRVQLEAMFHKSLIDVVHAHGIDVLPTALSFAGAHRIPLLIDLVDPIPVTSRNRRLLQAAVAQNATFCVPSAFMAAHLQQDLKLLSPRLFKIAPGIDTTWFEASRITAERVQALATQWRLPETATVIVSGAPVAFGHGHKHLLQSLASLKRPDLFLVIVGPSIRNFRTEIERMIKSLGLESQVALADYCNDWPTACWLASVMVAVNSVPRGTAQEILAAQSMGRPVIVTDCGANSELVKGGETAWLIPADNASALTSALDEATRMTVDQRLGLTESTRAFMLNSFTQTAWATAFFELYASLTGSAPKAPL